MIISSCRQAIGIAITVFASLNCSTTFAQEQSSEAPPVTAVLDADRLWAAARTGDLEALKKELDAGVPVDAKTAYGSTALCFACDRGHVEIVKLLLERGANPEVKDTFYSATPLTWAQSNGHHELMTLLLAAGASGADDLLFSSVATSDLTTATAALQSGKCSAKAITLARAVAAELKKDELIALLAGNATESLPPWKPVAETVAIYPGKFAMEGGQFKAEIAAGDDGLTFSLNGGRAKPLVPVLENEFLSGSNRITFDVAESKVTGITFHSMGRSLPMKPDTTPAEPAATEPATPAPAPEEPAAEESGPEPAEPWTPAPGDLAVSSVNWPGFRGTGSRGVADGQHPPATWDVEKGENILWKTAIPGLGFSCPSIWGNRVFVTSAVSETADTDVKIGQYGDVKSVEDDSEYQFNVYCLDRDTGSIIWQRTARTSKPMVKRHSKSSHANPTVATDGQHVVAFFGSEGLYCLDMEGNLLWEKDLGFLDSGWFLDPGYQWGFGSSPVIFGNRLIVQCDIQKNSFIASFNLSSGDEIWRQERDEIPSWPTPVVHQFGDMPMLITHGTHAARGYDARDGQLLWSLGDFSEIVVPTPSVSHDLIFLASGYAPVQPIVAIRPTARGELTMPGRKAEDGTKGPESIPEVAWNQDRGGPYMPSPIVYGDLLYCCGNGGVLTCLDAKSGEQVYKERIKTGGNLSFTASPVAADGRLYFTAEDGRVAVVRAGREFVLEHVNPCGSSALATPAIADGIFYLRTVTDLIACKEGASISATTPATAEPEASDK